MTTSGSTAKPIPLAPKARGILPHAAVAPTRAGFKDLDIPGLGWERFGRLSDQKANHPEVPPVEADY